MNVVIAGASGFVGKHLIHRLLKDHNIKVRALGRSLKNKSSGNLSNMYCDLFSLLDVEKALEGQNVAIYLVHSMLPSSQLSQGSFQDYDLILADNFARAAKKMNIKKIIYLGGIIPQSAESHPEELSAHLKSRLEVEEIFHAYQLPVVTLRAGMIMGHEGSSFQMLLRLVHRLPFMVCPAWTKSQSSPIHIRDVAESFYYVLNHIHEGTFDLENGQYISYFEMLEKCSKALNKNSKLINVPYFSPRFSKFWVKLITGAPKNLVYPLVDSLQHNMMPSKDKVLKIPNWQYLSFEESLKESIEQLSKNSQHFTEPKAYKQPGAQDHKRIVQSVQRHVLNSKHNAEWASQEYTRWLQNNFKGVIQVSNEGDVVTFKLARTQVKLLELTKSVERSFEDRILFYISGGLLAQETKRGRLEFRTTPDKKYLITAIHDFKPSLPWYLYKYSQALVHASVMDEFGAYLKTLD